MCSLSDGKNVFKIMSSSNVMSPGQIALPPLPSKVRTLARVCIVVTFFTVYLIYMRSTICSVCLPVRLNSFVATERKIIKILQMIRTQDKNHNNSYRNLYKTKKFLNSCLLKGF